MEINKNNTTSLFVSKKQGPFDSFMFHSLLNSALQKCGYTKPTPIQEQAIPFLQQGHDLLAISRTGSGKTAAYCLPLLDRLAKNKKKARPARMRGLILVPTRELALQVYESLKKYGKGHAFKLACFFGGVGMVNQVRSIGKGVDIIVSTPGRLKNIEKEGHAFFDQCEFIVLDEFDKMLDFGFQNDIQNLWKKFPHKAQTALFSATDLPEQLALLEGLLVSPQKITIADENKPFQGKPEKGFLEPSHEVYFIKDSSRKSLLRKILRKRSVKKAIVFVNTKIEAEEILKDLQKSFISSDSLHGDKDQDERMKSLAQFKRNKFKVLVATDLASRGLHIGGLDLIVNYNLPKDPRDYKHRVGRLCREDRPGKSINFCFSNDKQLILNLEKDFKKPFTIN